MWASPDELKVGFRWALAKTHIGKPRFLPHKEGPMWADYGHLMGPMSGPYGQTNLILGPLLHSYSLCKGYNHKAENSNTPTRGFDGTLKDGKYKY